MVKKLILGVIVVAIIILGIFAYTNLVYAAVTQDVSTSALDILGSSSVTTSAISTTSAGQTLFAFILSGGTAVGTVTQVTGCGLVWQRKEQVKASTDTDLELWWAYASTTVSSCTVNAKQSVINMNMSITVLSFSGASTNYSGFDSMGTTSTKVDIGGAGQPSITANSTRNGSWFFAASVDEFTNSPFTAGTSQTTITDHNDTVAGFRYNVWKQDSITPTAGTSVTTNGTYTPVGGYGMVLLEVVPPRSSVAQIFLTGNGLLIGSAYLY